MTRRELLTEQLKQHRVRPMTKWSWSAQKAGKNPFFRAKREARVRLGEWYRRAFFWPFSSFN